MNISNYTHEICLPSKGYLNPEIPEGKVIQRCMMVADQKFLASSDLSSDTITQELLKRTTDSPESLDVSNLTAADTLYLLFKLRILSYGESYKFMTRCPECGRKFDVDLDLSNIEVITLDPDYQSKLKVVLPRAGDTVYTKLLKNKDIADMKDELSRRIKKGLKDTNEFVLRLSSMITKIELKTPDKNGDTTLIHPIDIQNYVEKLTDLDATAIRATTDAVAYGISPVIEQKCPHCREYIEVGMPLGSGFFRPKYDLQSEKLD